MAKTKALISFAVTVNLICVFVFAYAKNWFSHDAAHFKCLTVALLMSTFNLGFGGEKANLLEFIKIKLIRLQKHLTSIFVCELKTPSTREIQYVMKSCQ